MDFSLLERLGLTKSEIAVYLALLELGSSSAGSIIDKSGVSSSKIYEITDRLIDKGLVSFVLKANVKHFQAAPPSRLVDYVEEQEQDLQTKKDQLQGLLPELELKRTLAQSKSEAKIYRGYKGMETAFYDALSLLEKSKEFLVIGVPSRTEAQNRFFVRFLRKCDREGIISKAIFNEEARGELQTTKAPYTQIKFVPESMPAAINIFNDRVIIFPQSVEEELLIVIDDAAVAESFRVQFQSMWDRDANTVIGFEAVTKKFEDEITAMKEGEEYHVLGASLELADEQMQTWLDKLHTMRIKQGKRVKFLTQHEAYEDIIRRTKKAGDSDMRITDIRNLSPEFTTPFQINLFHGDRVWFVLWEEGIRCFEIISKDIYQNFKTYFDALWTQETLVEQGFDAMHDIFIAFLDELQQNKQPYRVIGAAFGSKGVEQKYVDAFQAITTERIKRKISSQIIYEQDVQQHLQKKNEGIDETAEWKFLPYKTESPVAIIPSKEKTLLVIQKEEPTIITINNPEVSAAFQASFKQLWNQRVQVYEGADGIRAVIQQMLDFGDYVVLAEGMKIYDTVGKNFFEWWQAEKKRRGIKSKLIMGSQYKAKPTITKATIEEARFIPGYENTGATLVFDDKVIIMEFAGTPTAVIIESKDLAEVNRTYFDHLWNQEAHTVKGLDAVQAVFEEMLDAGSCDFLGARGYFMDARPEFVKDWWRRAEKQGFRMRNITDSGVKGHTITKFPFVETKYTLQKEFAQLSVFWIYGDTVAIANWVEKEPIVTIINNKSLVSMYKEQFESLWKQ